METVVLEEFLTYAQQGSLSRAAAELHLSPSSLSRHMSSLEQQIGMPLFTGRQPGELTPSGRIVFEDASAIIERYNAMLDKVSAVKRGETETLRLSFFTFDKFLTGIVARAMDKTAEPSAGLNVSIVKPNGRRPLDMLAVGDADIVISPLEEDESRKRRLESRLIAPTHLYASLHESIAPQGNEIALTQLSGLTLRYPLAPDSLDYCDYMIELFRRHSVELNVKRVAFASTEESLLNDTPDWLLLFSEPTAINGDPLPPETAKRRRMFRVSDKDASINWRAVWLKDRETPELLRFVDSLHASAEELLD